MRQGKPRAAMKLLRKCSALLKSHGASNVELSNGWLNESAAMSAAGDQAAALRCAEKSAAILHEDIEKFETSVSELIQSAVCFVAVLKMLLHYARQLWQGSFSVHSSPEIGLIPLACFAFLFTRLPMHIWHKDNALPRWRHYERQ